MEGACLSRAYEILGDLTPMLTDRFPFERVTEAFDAVTARNDTRIKVMVDFE